MQCVESATADEGKTDNISGMRLDNRLASVATSLMTASRSTGSADDQLRTRGGSFRRQWCKCQAGRWHGLEAGGSIREEEGHGVNLENEVGSSDLMEWTRREVAADVAASALMSHRCASGPTDYWISSVAGSTDIPPSVVSNATTRLLGRRQFRQ